MSICYFSCLTDLNPHTMKSKFISLFISIVCLQSYALGQSGSSNDSVSVSFQGDMCAENSFSISLAGSSASGDGDDCGDYWESNTATADLTPETQYTLTISGGVCTGHVSLSESSTCYELYIDGSAASSITSGDGDPGSGDGSWTVELRPVSDQGGDIGGSEGGIASFFTNTYLGSLPDGSSAGRLTIKADVIPVGGFRPSDLRFAGPATSYVAYTLEMIDDTGTVISDYYDNIGTTTIRQILTDSALADVTYDSVNDQVEIVFYEPSGSMTKTSGYYDPGTLGLTEINRTEIVNVSATEFDLKFIEGTTTRTTSFEKNTATGAWEMTVGGETVSLTKTITGSGSTYQRVETRTTKVSGNTVRVIEDTYKAVETEQNAYIPLLVRVRMDPGGSDERVTIHKYYDPTSAPGESFKWGFKEYTVFPDGTWEKYDYDQYSIYNDLQPGRPARIFRPWMDSPALPTAATESNAHVTHYEYVNFWHDLQFANEVSLIEERIEGKTVSKITRNYGGTGAVLSSPVNQDAIKVVTERKYFDSTNYLETITKTYNPRHPDWPSRPYSTKKPDSSMRAYAYEKGVWNETSKTFTAGGAETAIRVSRVEGSNSSTGAEQRTTLNGVTIESIYLIVNESTKNERILDLLGNVCYEANYVFTGGGDNWTKVDWMTHDYTNGGNLERTDYSNGTYYEANWQNGEKQWETSVEGIRTNFTYDSRGRVSTATIDGLSGVIDDRIMTYSYDIYNTGCGCLTGNKQEITSPGHADTITIYTDVDKAGRKKQTRDANGVVIDYDYTDPTITINSNFEVTGISGSYEEAETMPESRSLTRTYFRDGQLKSVTGNAAVNRYHDYDYTVITGTEAHRVEKVTQASSTGNRWTEFTTDWLDRQTKQRKPAFTSGQYYTVENIYDTNTGLLKETQQPGMADTLYFYDSTGDLTESGLDVDNNGQLDPISEDRYSEFSRDYLLDNGNWYSHQATTTYLKNNASSDKMVSTVKRQLTSLDASTGVAERSINETVYYNDSGTKITTLTQTTETTIDRTNKKVTSEISSSSRLPIQRISENGYITEIKQELPDSETYVVTRQYDDLGRITQESNSTGRTIDTYYVVDSNLVDYTDSTEVGELDFTYNNMAEVSSIQNDTGKMTYMEYNGRGQLVRHWGNAVYPVRYDYDDYGLMTDMWTFRSNTSSFETSTWPTAEESNGDLTEWEYQDATGLLIKKYDATNSFVEYIYDSANRIDFRYWQRDNPALTPGTRLETDYSYDLDTGDLTGINYADNTTDIIFQYDRVGRRSEVTDDSGTRTLSYQAGYLLAESYSSGDLSGWSVSRDLNSDARMDKLYLKSNAVNIYQADYDYDTAGRLDTVGYGDHLVDYGYKANTSQIEDITFKENSSLIMTDARTYERGNLLKSIGVKNASNVQEALFTYTNDTLGRREQRDDLGSDYWKYGYDSRNQVVTAQRWRTASPDITVPGYDYDYSYDGIGNRIDSDLNGATTQYTRNALNQYTAIDRTSKVSIVGQADASSTVTVTTTGTNPTVTRLGANYYAQKDYDTGTSADDDPSVETITVEGRLTGGGSQGSDRVAEMERDVTLRGDAESLSYDDDGNLLADALWDYTWNAENRLIQMETSSAAVTAGVERQLLDFAYDSQGRRFKKVTSSWDSGSSSWQQDSATYFLYDGWNLLAEINAQGQILESYVWGLDLSGSLQGAGGVGGLLIVANADAAHYPYYDGNGNVMGSMDSSSGSISATFEYGPFGEMIQATGSTDNMPFRFSTKYKDTETGLLYYGYRYYDATLGRWLNRDPIGERGGLNLYAFVDNDGANQWDMLGLAAEKKLWDEGIFLTIPTSAISIIGSMGFNKFTDLVSIRLRYFYWCNDDGEASVDASESSLRKHEIMTLIRSEVAGTSRDYDDAKKVLVRTDVLAEGGSFSATRFMGNTLVGVLTGLPSVKGSIISGAGSALTSLDSNKEFAGDILLIDRVYCKCNAAGEQEAFVEILKNEKSTNDFIIKWKFE